MGSGLAGRSGLGIATQDPDSCGAIEACGRVREAYRTPFQLRPTSVCHDGRLAPPLAPVPAALLTWFARKDNHQPLHTTWRRAVVLNFLAWSVQAVSLALWVWTADAFRDWYGAANAYNLPQAGTREVRGGGDGTHALRASRCCRVCVCVGVLKRKRKPVCVCVCMQQVHACMCRCVVV